MIANSEPLIVAFVLATVLMLTGQFAFDKTIGRRRALSAAAGGSVAYIFVNLLPELENAATLFRQTVNWLPYEGAHGVNLAMMIGYLCFYALQEMLPAKYETDENQGKALAFWAQLLGYGGYIYLIGYLLIHSLEKVEASLFLYALSMCLHFMLVGHGLREIYQGNYDRVGRYVLAGLCVAGWLTGTMFELPKPFVILLLGFVSGGVLSVTSIVELPKGGEGKFAPFLMGAFAYAALLIVCR